VSASFGERARELVAHLRRGAGEVEIFEKRGRSRRCELGPEGESFGQSVEAGWAARGGDARRSWFVGGSGEPPRALAPPPATAPGLRLPPPSALPLAAPPPGLEASLATESEGRALLAGVARELVRELPDVGPPRLRLDEGASEWALVSSHEVIASGRGRSAVLRVEAARGETRLVAEFVARSADELKPLALARRLADRLLALGGGAAPRDAGTLVLAPPVVARLVEALAPRLVGAGAERRLDDLLPRDGRLGATAVTLVDDGSEVAGLLASPCDGEGVPTGAVTLVERGRFVRPLTAWWESEAPSRAFGCARRDGWRDVPRHGPTQLFLAPDPAHAVADLVAGVKRGAYLIAAEGGVRLDAAGRELSLPVSGFALAGGRAAGGLGRCRLHGTFAALLGGLRAVGRDLAFVAGDGMYGAPTAVVDGLALVPDGD
jgi:predicted Zn-dependent protease